MTSTYLIPSPLVDHLHQTKVQTMLIDDLGRFANILIGIL